MRAALISITEVPPGDLHDASAGSARYWLAHRQLRFALAAGAERIIVHGEGSSPLAIALHHAAEKSGARFQAVRRASDLRGAVADDDELLVLAPDLLPESPAALTSIRSGQGILVIPAAAGVAAGFERIDLGSAWAGALSMSGILVQRIAELPDDSDPAPALLRIALQARLPQIELPESDIAKGYWTVPAELVAAERGWLDRHLPEVEPFSITATAARTLLSRFGFHMLGNERSLGMLVASGSFLLWSAIAVAWFALPWVGLILTTLGAVILTLGGYLADLRSVAAYRQPQRHLVDRLLAILVDITLLATAAAAIDGSIIRQLFPPTVLILAIAASKPREWSGFRASFGDRGFLALLFVVPAALGLAEPAIMIAGLLILGLHAASVSPATAAPASG